MSKNRIDKRKRFLEHRLYWVCCIKEKVFLRNQVHMIVSNQGRPIEIKLRAGSESDITVLWQMELDIPEEAILYADGAYNCFELEDILQEQGVRFMAKRGVNGKNRLRSKIEEKRSAVNVKSLRQHLAVFYISFQGILGAEQRKDFC